MEPKPRCDGKTIIEREEYEALMSELPASQEEPKHSYGSPELDEKLRKIEFYMLIIVGLILVVLTLSLSKMN